MEKRVLVVEDEPGVQELLRLNLSMCGYNVDQAFNVDEAQRLMVRNTPDLVLADWNIPGQSGVSLVRLLRKHDVHKFVPIIMLTARDDVSDKLLAFDAGADDYVTKPFRVSELLARVKTLLRRADWNGDQDFGMLHIDGLVLNDTEKRVLVGKRELSLSATEYKLLLLLASRPMMIYSRVQLIQQVWGNDCDMQERTVDVAIARLRGQLEALGHHPCIETVRSMGYRFVKREEMVTLHG
jgi:two-component system, OmpR family, phosphate regulon response regulator PhoB